MEYFFVIDIFCKESDKKLLYDTIMDIESAAFAT